MEDLDAIEHPCLKIFPYFLILTVKNFNVQNTLQCINNSF